MLIISSRTEVERVVEGCTRFRNFRIRRTISNVRTVRVYHGRSFSLVVVSIVVPRLSNFSTYERVEGFGGAPVVVLSTENRRCSGVRNFRLNDSSCIIGPFSPGRLVVHIGTMVGHSRNTRGRSGIGGSMFACRNLSISFSTEVIAVSNGEVRVAPGRCRLFFCVMGGGKLTLAHRGLVDRI